MLSLILVETVGISIIQHCCGSTEILHVLSEMDMLCAEKSCDTADDMCHHHCADHESEAADHCQDHMAQGLHKHHHDDNCIDTDFYQLSPEQNSNFSHHELLSILLIEIKLFDFTPQPVIIPLTDKYAFTIPREAGRHKLALYSVFLI